MAERREHRGPSTTRFLPVVVPLALAAFLALTGHPARAQILVGVGVVMAGLLALGVPVADLVARTVSRVVSVVAVIGYGVLFVLCVLPCWLWGQIRHRGRQLETDGWVRTSVAPEAAVELGAGAPEAKTHLVTRLVGLVVVVALVDYGAGWAWDEVFEDQRSTEPVPTFADQFALPTDSAGVLAPDPRADVPAMGGAPWAPRYFADLRNQRFGYWPFTQDRPLDFTSAYINVADWARASWVDDGAPDDVPVVWFFGGSAMFGEGQRDDFTIPSVVARTASEEGQPVRVVNFGQRGWVHYQEMLLFEQQLGVRDAPDFVVFYDGPNDLQAAAMFGDPVPASLHEDQWAQKIWGVSLVTEVRGDGGSVDLVDELRRAYLDHSLVSEALHGVGLVAEPAGAAPAQDAPPIDGQRGPDGHLLWGSEDDGRQAMQVYERGRALSTALSERHEVTPIFFWQPVSTDQDAVRYAQANLSEPTIDLSHIFDDGAPVYIDTTHTNEQGARLVAEAMWTWLRPAVQRWYDGER